MQLDVKVDGELAFLKKKMSYAEYFSFACQVYCTEDCVVLYWHLPCTLTHLLSVFVMHVGDAMFLSSATHPDHKIDQPSD